MNFYNNTDILVHFGIRGMKWGVRRFENADGTLTEAGKKRYSEEKLKNDSKKKENRMEENTVQNVNRWVENDIENAKRVADSSSDLIRKGQDLERATRLEKKRMDLSKMSDQEMRERINRELLERQYDDLFNKQKVSKGRQKVKEVLDIAGSVTGITGTALGIALTIHKLKHG